MKKNKFELNKIIIILSAVLLVLVQIAVTLNGAYAFTTNGTGRIFDFAITSGKNADISSPSFRTYSVIGDVISTINSSNFKTEVGFLRTLPYLNGEPCQVSAECIGGFCCSNVCKSSACPAEGGGEIGGDGAAGGGAAAAAGGGGSGGGFFTKQIEEKNFTISPSLIKEQLALGGSKIRTIMIRNTGNTALNFSLGVAAVNDFIFLSETSFSLNAGEEKTIEANIIGKKLGSYAGEIEVSGDEIKKSISIVVEVESEQVLLDVKIDIPSGYKKIVPGDELKAQTTLFNIAGPKKVNVLLNYFIKDLKGNIIIEQSETITVEDQLSFTKSFIIPKDAKRGLYLASVEAIYANSFAVSSELFEIVGERKISGIEIKKLYPKSMLFYFSLAIIIILLAIVIIYYIPAYRDIKSKRLRRNFSMLAAETDRRIRTGQFGEAVKAYRRLDSVYRSISQSSLDDKLKIGLYKDIRRLYGILARMKNEK